MACTVEFRDTFASPDYWRADIHDDTVFADAPAPLSEVVGIDRFAHRAFRDCLGEIVSGDREAGEYRASGEIDLHSSTYSPGTVVILERERLTRTDLPGGFQGASGNPEALPIVRTFLPYWNANQGRNHLPFGMEQAKNPAEALTYTLALEWGIVYTRSWRTRGLAVCSFDRPWVEDDETYTPPEYALEATPLTIGATVGEVAQFGPYAVRQLSRIRSAVILERTSRRQTDWFNGARARVNGAARKIGSVITPQTAAV